MARGGTRSTGRPRALPASRTQSHQRRFSTCFFAYPPLRGEIEFPRGRNRSEGILFLGKLRYADARSAVKSIRRARVSFTSFIHCLQGNVILWLNRPRRHSRPAVRHAPALGEPAGSRFTTSLR